MVSRHIFPIPWIREAASIPNWGPQQMSETLKRFTIDTQLELLSNSRRRQILNRVADTPGGTTVEELQNALQRRTGEDEDEDLTGGIQHYSLHHVHLPKLQQANVLEYDPNRRRIRRGRHFDDLFTLLQLVEKHCNGPSTTAA